MTGGRSDILARVRAANGADGPDSARAARVRERLEHPPVHLRPDRAGGDQAALRRSFIAMAEAASASVAELADLHAVPQAVATYLAKENLPGEIIQGPDPDLARIPWKLQSPLAVTTVERLADTREPAGRPDRPSRGDVPVLTRAALGVGETGTLVFFSGPAAPASLNFLPETLLVLLPAQDLARHYETAWDTLRERHAQSGRNAPVLPRGVHFITGPSRSADIEQKILLGAHGPRRLHILLVDEL